MILSVKMLLEYTMFPPLKKFHHPLIKCLHRGEFIWNLANVPLLERYIYALAHSTYLEVIKEVIEQFKANIVPKLSTFRPCEYLIHLQC